MGLERWFRGKDQSLFFQRTAVRVPAPVCVKPLSLWETCLFWPLCHVHVLTYTYLKILKRNLFKNLILTGKEEKKIT